MEFVTKITDNKNKNLQYHAIYLIENLKPLQLLYFREHSLISIILVMRSLKETCIIDKSFNNL